MSSDEVVQYQIEFLTDAIGELRTANEKQAEFNQTVVGFMASAATWGKVAALGWLVGQGLLVAALVKALDL